MTMFAYSMAIVALLAFGGARAQEAETTFDAAEERILSANPDLARVRERAPMAARFVLNEMEAAKAVPAPPPRRSLDRPALSPEEEAILGRNPALQEMFRSSPEAAHDLLILIRRASGAVRPEPQK